jgi:hypothetical protein
LVKELYINNRNYNQVKKLRTLPLLVALVVILSGCLGTNTPSTISQSPFSESLVPCPLTHPGYGEFNGKEPDLLPALKGEA